MNEIAVLDNLVAEKVFDGESLEPLLNKLRSDVCSIVPSVKTAKDRKEVASIAAKISKSKVYLDGLGKDMVADWKTKAKGVDAQRKFAKEFLDEVKADFRAPLTKWEEKEAERVDKFEGLISETIGAGTYTEANWDNFRSVDVMVDGLNEIKSLGINSEWEEFEIEGKKAQEEAIVKIQHAIDRRVKYDEEQLELAILREQAAEREQSEKEEQLRREGEEKAKLEAELKTNQDAERAEKEKQDAINLKIEAERKEKETRENSSRLIEEAKQKEREKIEVERVEAERQAQVREADKEHRATINRMAVTALMVDAKLDEKQAKAVVTAIAKAKIPNVKISY